MWIIFVLKHFKQKHETDGNIVIMDRLIIHFSVYQQNIKAVWD